jgi:protein O-GlcNAc transferase
LVEPLAASFALYERGNAHFGQRQFLEAIACYEAAIRLNPVFAEAHGNRGTAMIVLGKYDEALTSCRRAVELNANYTEAYCNLGIVLRAKGCPTEALEALDRAIELDPAMAEGHNLRGIVLSDLVRPADAISSFDRALAIRPEFLDALTNRAAVCLSAGDSDGGKKNLERAHQLAPNSLRIRLAQCIAHLKVAYRSSDEIAVARRSYQDELMKMGESLDCRTAENEVEAVEAVGSMQPFFLSYQGNNDRELQRRYGRLVCGIMAAWADRRGIGVRRSRHGQDKKLKIAIVSGQMRRHSVWDIITKGILATLDYSRFDALAYNTTGEEDLETRPATSKCLRYYRGPASLEHWVERIAADAPDAILYPEIGMDGQTMKLACLRLAPLQVAAWGHPATTGLPTIDCFISGRLLEPADADNHYSERLIRLPNLGCRIDPFGDAIADVSLTALGIPEVDGLVRFVSCQHAFKYLPQHDWIYPAIAKALPDSHFIFARHRRSPHASALLQERLMSAFDVVKLDGSKFCSFIDELPRPQYLGLLAKADVYLDTVLFSGFTTAAQALQVGLPLVTMEGPLMRSRLASALLRRIEVTETIATTVDEYVSIAVRLGGDIHRRKQVRHRIAAQRAKLFGDEEPVRELERLIERFTTQRSLD